MKRLLAALIVVVIATGGNIAENLPENLKRSVEAREYSAATTELVTLQSNNAKFFAENNFDYLLARLAESDGQAALAMSNYQAVANRDSVLSVYALKHLSQIARSTGNLMLERIYLSEIEMFNSDSLLANGATLRLTHNSFERGNYGETIRILTNGNSAASSKKLSGKNPLFRENQAFLGETYLQTAQTAQARDIFTGLINKMPNPVQPDDVSLTAARGLDLMDGGRENFGKKAPQLPEAESFRRANIYQFNRDFADAKLHFEALIANYPNGANATEAAFQIGRGFAQQGAFVEALAWFERVLEQYSVSNAAKEALLQAASAYGRVGKHKEAIKRYQTFIDKYPTDEKLDRAYLNIVDILRDQGNDSDALKWCRKTEDVFRGKPPEAIAVFTEARIYIAKEDWPNALTTIERLKNYPDLGGATVPGGTNTAEVTFLKAFVLDQSKRFAEAIDTYLSIPDGRGEYYGWRATERLKALAKDEASRPFAVQKAGVLADGLKSKDGDTRRKNATGILRLSDLPELREKAATVLKAVIKALPKYQGIPAFKPLDENGKLPPGNAGDPHRQIAEKLLVLGLYDEAAPEIDAAMPDSMADGRAYWLAQIFQRGDRAERGMAFIELQWKKVPADFPVELLPRDQLEMLYPAPYAGELLASTAKQKVDPRLMLAIMRQESRFDPDAKSYAAARGLMQFISTTSTQIAGELGRGDFLQEDLYYPPTAIDFGSKYLADLFKNFPNQPDAVAASYNGGDGNMKRWLARARSNLPERYVPEVVYAQSKDYVYKVMANYRMYQYLYDENLRPR